MFKNNGLNVESLGFGSVIIGVKIMIQVILPN